MSESPYFTETVLDVHHWTDAYFSFTTTRDPGLRFDNGQFVMIGLQVETPDGRVKPLVRAYSVAARRSSWMPRTACDAWIWWFERLILAAHWRISPR